MPSGVARATLSAQAAGSPKHEGDSDWGPRNRRSHGLSQNPQPCPGTRQNPSPEGRQGKRLPIATQPSLSTSQPGTGHVMRQLPHPSAKRSAAPGHVNHSTGRDWDQPSAGVRWPGYLGNSTRDGNHSHGQECASTQRFTGQPCKLDASQSSLGKRGRGLRGSACLVPHCPGDRRQQGSPSGEVHGLNPNEKQTADRSSRQLQPLGSKV